jgi:hypothetical protein
MEEERRKERSSRNRRGGNEEGKEERRITIEREQNEKKCGNVEEGVDGVEECGAGGGERE